MNWTKSLVAALLPCISLIACNEKAQDPPYFTPEVRSGAEAVPEIPYIPTNPTGGFIPGKPPSLDPEENARRQAANTVKPIVWGESIAGISLNTSYNDAKKILAQRLVSNGSVEVYPESIQIAWRATVPPTPELILAFGTYGGKLKLPNPIGEVSLGDNFSQHFANDPNGGELMRLLGAYFEGKDPKNYDCRKELSCAISFFNNTLFLEFKKGALGFDSSFRLDLVYIVENQNFFPRLTGDLVYGQSIGDLTLETTRSQLESQLGPAQGVNGNLLFYDDLNLIVAWNSEQKPAIMVVQQDYMGKILIPGIGDGSFQIGDSFADIVDSDDDGTLLIQALDRALHNREADYNCLSLEEETCKWEVSQGVLLLHLQKGTFAFSNDAEKRLRWVSITPERSNFSTTP